MTVQLTHSSATRPPATSAIEISEGRATRWTTSGNRVGRFARELTGRERAALQRAMSDARSAAQSETETHGGPPAAPHRVEDTLTGDGLPEVVMAGGAAPPAGFARLVRLLRRLREDLAESPVAALALEVDGTPLGARLMHKGSEPITVRAGTVTVRWAVFDADSSVVGTATHSVDLALTGPVAPGWSVTLATDLGPADLPPRGLRTVTVGAIDVDSLGDGVLRPAVLSWSSG